MVLILMGPMGSGKTTIGKMLAEKLGWSFYDGDDFHPKKNVEKMRAGVALTDEDRKVWLEKLHANIQHWLRSKQNAILACSALKQAYRDILGVNQGTVKTVYLKGSYELLRTRIEGRQHPYMDKNLLRSQLETLEEPKDGLTVDISATPETIVRTILDDLETPPFPRDSSKPEICGSPAAYRERKKKSQRQSEKKSG
jgi:carbohydrate kinase (thermoresistant glucokinase family)